MTTARLSDAVATRVRDHRFALQCIGVFLAVRAVGLAILAWLAAVHHTTLTWSLTLWDGEWMLGIARYGYAGVPATFADANGVHTDDTAYAFFPGYPMLVRAVAFLPGMDETAAAMTINVVAGAAAAVAIGRLGVLCATRVRPAVRLPAPDAPRAGLLLVVLFAATPMSVVLNMAYTEALFCAVAAWALVGVLDHRWILAGCCALGAGLVRPTGIAVIATVMLAALVARRDGPRAWIAAALAPVGYLSYLAVVWARTGSPTGWFRIQTEGWNTTVDFGRATWSFLADTFGYAGDFASVATALVIVTVPFLLLWSAIDRVPWPILLFGVGVVASILLSDGLMLSRIRLLLPAFVILIPIALRLAHRPRGEVIPVSVALTLFSGWFGAHMLTVFGYAI
ncbi:hypothetical protein [Gordonia shandongensis]|uniref:hypothetical protein n=1 Tax=Gordonia shandongensis TaxID=376351 RepID=UPI0004265EC1|nr:hypothetical protein [Gordonia shandongensis]